MTNRFLWTAWESFPGDPVSRNWGCHLLMLWAVGGWLLYSRRKSRWTVTTDSHLLKRSTQGFLLLRHLNGRVIQPHRTSHDHDQGKVSSVQASRTRHVLAPMRAHNETTKHILSCAPTTFFNIPSYYLISDVVQWSDVLTQGKDESRKREDME